MPLDVTARKTVAEEELEACCTGLVLAVSGGADSMAMLQWYASRTLPFPITVAHVHHGLRKESDGEEVMVQTYCEARSIPCRILHTDVQRERRQGETVESAARRLRYEFFHKVAAEQNASHLATAHTQNDQAETVLLHLIHGAGPRGLCGIFPKHTRNGLTVIRPLLRCSRADTEQYCAENKIPFAVDESNRDPTYTRNRIRHEILPKMKELNPNLCETLSRTAAVLQRQQQAAKDRAEKFLSRQRNGILHSELILLPPAEQAEILRRWFSKKGKELSAEQTEQALHLLRKPEGTVEFDRRWRLHLGQGRLTLEEKGREILLPPLQVTEAPISLPDGRTLQLIPTRATEQNRKTLLSATLPLTLRTRRPGDRFQTAAGTKTLAKRMMERRMPLPRRNSALVLADGARILWCEGIGSADKTAPNPGESGYFIALSEE